MRVSKIPFLALFAILARAKRSDDDLPTTTTHIPECTATSSTGSGAFFDLRPDIATSADSEKAKKKGLHKDYHAKGYDYGKNFTINICNSVVDPVTNVQGIKEAQWANVSAYYMSHGNIYSIGSQSMDLQSRGRKLVLQYTNGSPCGEPKSKDTRDSVFAESYNTHVIETYSKKPDVNTRRKSATISFLCDRDPTSSQASISFVGTDPDECAYFFEARSTHACAHAEPHKPGSVGPGSVFGLILAIAVLVYFLGGVFYNRTVSHARGWRQLPNYSLWAGIWSFVCDIFVIATSSCARCLPGRRGYSHLSATDHPRNRTHDAENRLIDQLDEEWDE